MKFDDIPADTIIIRVKRTDYFKESLKEQHVFDIKACAKRPGEFEICLEKTVIFVKPVVEIDIRRLNNELAAGRSMLSRIANIAADNSFELQIKFFAGERVEMGDVEIGVNKYAEKMIEKIDRKLSDKILYDYLKNRCCFICGNEMFFFIIAGHAIDDELKVDNEDSAHRPEPTRKNSFCIMGDNIRFVATETQLPDGKSIYIPTRLSKPKNKSDRALRLARGNLKFVDWTKAGQIQILTKAQMNNLIKDEGSYLKKWDEFGDIEGELLLKQARAIGVLQYRDMQPNREDGTVSVRISQASEYALNELAAGNVKELEWIESIDKLPDYLKNPDLKFAEYVSSIEKNIEKKELMGEQKQTEEKNQCFKVKYDRALNNLTISDPESEELMVETKELPPEGVFIFSLLGDSVQIERRITARRAILEGRSANPQLGLLIEEKGEITQTRPQPKVKPLTAFVRNKIFDNPPTIKQEEAIKAALSTPDIALIQGPPGTGKTTVIAAILERLNEMADKRQKNIKGQVLLTGFQHDAVENMINRRSLNGIPIPKFGKRPGTNEYGYGVFEENLEKWGEETAEKLRAKDLNIAEVEKEMEIKNLCLQYIKVPARLLAADLAKNIASLDVTIIGENISRRAANIAKRLSREETLNPETNPLLDAVRRLRTRPESFADDGPDRAADALEDLKNDIEKNEMELLDRASLWHDNDIPPPFLNDLDALKKRLMVKFTLPPVFSVEKQSDEILALAEEAIRKIKEAGFSAKDKKSAALAEFLAELESNPYGMIDAVSDYSYAFAATCQQSVNKLMRTQKGITGNAKQRAEQKMEYEYVIVDEAARVSPRDLMIPMAQGKRIILVGDHRQLPHIIDKEVADQMDEGEVSEKETEWLKNSMFNYLFTERIKVLEQKDGITRRITLDKQYRMHPLLGDFISRNFYEWFAPSEKFSSGRPERDFIHNLPGTDNKPAIWLDIPNGISEKNGTSWIRNTEVTAIAEKLKIWMKEREDLSFGVISFYKAQADLIKKQLKLAGITDDDKKLLVGTVDSFQGMEFDVVFLSMVRTSRENRKPKDDDREKQAHSLFGRLCLYNLLNVSMSRQKKLLVVAGDSGLLKSDLAVEFIPGLVNFYKLCLEKGKVL
jgi:DNA polymerase III delta prime subunit